MRADPPSADPWALRPVLARVSRSFYLTLRLLPHETSDLVALAYLLARAADTVADTRLVAATERARLLEELAVLYRGEGDEASAAATLAELAALPPSDDALPEEHALLGALGPLVAALGVLPAEDRRDVRWVLGVLLGGMSADLRRFPGDGAGEPRALETRAELRDYCYRVAGCVGEFWARVHARRLRRCRRLPLGRWARAGVRLGLALQLTNVLRDLPRDLEHGRCYLPRAELAVVGLDPAALRDPGVWPRLRPLYLSLVADALGDARVGLEHVLLTPSREASLRLAALLPLLLALETLGLVARGNPLDPQSPRKVPRRAVYRLLLAALPRLRDPAGLGRLYRRTLRRSGLAGLEGA